MNDTRLARLVADATTSMLIASAAILPSAALADPAGWPAYGGASGGGQYSSARQITPANVGKLKLAWTFRTGELGAGLARPKKLTFESNSILAEGRLYLITALDKVFALDPATGREIWHHDASPGRGAFSELAARGVSSWVDPRAASDGACRHRIFFGTLDARLVALDGATGLPCAGFGGGGTVNLRDGLRIRDAGDYLVTSPPAVAGDVVVVGSAIGDNRAVDVERGVVRAFDARSGALLWSWDPIPTGAADGWRPEQARATGAANAWAPMSVDAARGLVYIPTGSASPDFYGGERLGANRDANSLVAIVAATGKVAWRQQLIHHDLWDYDLASQPVLADIDVAGRRRAAVMQATKTGMLFVFDRETGEPLYPIEERAVPASDVPGEEASKTQPFPIDAFIFARHAAVTPDAAWGFTPIDRGMCRDKIAALRSEGIFTPPSTRGTIAYPSWAGGVNWGGIAFDPVRQRVIVAVAELPMVVTLLPRERAAGASASAAAGTSTGLYSDAADPSKHKDSEFARMSGTPYAMRREVLVSPLGVPCTAPPWGRLVAIDLAQPKQRWDWPIGTTAKKAPIALDLGMPFMGGPVATASGIVFIAGTTDDMFRAIDVDTGKTLWETQLPAGGNATPSIYEIGGKEYVVIAAGGHGSLGTTMGDYVLAFALSGD